MKRSNDNPFPNGQIRTPVSNIYQNNGQPQMTFQPHVFTPVHYTKPNEVRPLNIPTHYAPTSHTYHSPTSNEQVSKKNHNPVKPLEEKLEVCQPQKKITKPAFLNSQKQIHVSDTSSTITQDSISIRKEQSEPYLYNQGLRSTFSNIIKKSQITNHKEKASGLRVTHGFGKFGSVMMEAKKYDEQEQQKHCIKNGFSSEVISPTHHRVIESVQYKNPTIEHKKIIQPVHKTLEQINSSRTQNKDKATIINGFAVFKQLGKGKFGQVHLARHIQTGFVVALKKIIKAKVTQYKMIEQFKRQIRLHSALDHPNIVKFYGFFEDAENIYLILEYISGGTLFDYLDQEEHLTPKVAAEFLKDTIQAISYLHERSIAHRDIKPQNIVLTAEKVAKLCDFGWSAFVESSRTTYCGTFDYAPPQILERKNYNTAVDMWCIGVLAYELMTGRVPFQGEKKKDIMQKIISVDKTKIEYPVNIPEDARSFIELLVQKDPSLRPKCKDLLRHPFIVNNTKKPSRPGNKKGFQYEN